MKKIIELKNLSKIYNEAGQELKVLNRVSFNISKGEFIAIMGPSGSGKTTLLNMIGCLDRPSSGSYKFEGEEIAKKSQKELAKIRNQKIGFIFQTFNLLPRYNVIANVNLPRIYANEKLTKKEIMALLEKVGLAERAKHKPSQLSGGEQQRVAIARALINNPEIILADEPTGNLDQKTGREIMTVLKKLNDSGVTLIVVTHDSKIAKYADRIIQIEDGKIV